MWKYVFGLSVVVGLIAGTITINSQCDAVNLNYPDLSPAWPISTPEISEPEPKEPTPTSEPLTDIQSSLENQLKVAKTVYYWDERAKALLIVAQQAILHGEYPIAIDAAAATPYLDNQAHNLAFVVRCAIEDGVFGSAMRAADLVEQTSSRDELISEVLAAQKRNILTPPTSVASRTSMSCFETD